MSWFRKYRESLHWRRVKKQQLQKKVEEVAWHQKRIGKIGLLINVELLETDVFKRFVKKLGKITQEVQLLGFTEAKEVEASLPIAAFSKKEVDWIWRPKGEKVVNFTKQSFDVLINLCQNNCYPLEYIAVAADAKYKIGALTNYPSNYDLMLETENVDFFINQVEFFLAKFRTQYEAV